MRPNEEVPSLLVWKLNTGIRVIETREKFIFQDLEKPMSFLNFGPRHPPKVFLESKLNSNSSPCKLSDILYAT